MFTQIARRAANAVIVTALAATMLVSASAFAAPAETTPPADDSTVARIESDLKIPVADFHVTAVDRIELNGIKKINYLFRVRNLGPSTAAVRIESGWVGLTCNHCPADAHEGAQIVTLAKYEEREIRMICEAAWRCEVAYVRLEPVRAIDPNTGNNRAEFQTPW